jgi:transcriptional regulator with XRE-family HTH domain
MNNRIKAIREERGIEQKDFADAMGVDRVTVWRWEKHHTAVPYETVIKMAQYFQVTPAHIFPDLAEVPPALAEETARA